MRLVSEHEITNIFQCLYYVSMCRHVHVQLFIYADAEHAQNVVRVTCKAWDTWLVFILTFLSDESSFYLLCNPFLEANVPATVPAVNIASC
jgi:hypothetical protein